MSCDDKPLNTDGIEVPRPDCLLGGWVDNVTKWLSTRSSDVICYLLETLNDFDGKALKAYKLQQLPPVINTVASRPAFIMQFQKEANFAT